MKVLNFGSLNIDYVYKVDSFVTAGETKSAEYIESFAGGKGLNQSIALRKAGIPVYHAGNCGASGKLLLDTLKLYEVDTQYISTSDVDTGHAIIQVDNEGENCILLFTGSNNCISKKQIDTVLNNFATSDILLLQNEINNVPYLIKEGSKRGFRMFLNPAPISSEILNLNLESIETLILNKHELFQFVSNKNMGINESIDEICTQYPTVNVLVTLGSEGGIYKQYDKSPIFYHSYKTEIIDSTAAGDTFIGFFIAGILAEETTSHILNFAAMASSLCISNKGAAISIPTKQEVIQYI